METMVFDRGGSTFMVNQARLIRSVEEIDQAGLDHADGWDVDQANPFITWVAGDFVEGDKANSNKQFWTAGDLELAEYTIRYAPLNMVHKFRTPVGFYAATRTVSLERSEAEAASLISRRALDELVGYVKDLVHSDDAELARVHQMAAKITQPVSSLDEATGSMKIQALSGMWSHIFPFETSQVEAASEEGSLFFSMECRGSHLICSGTHGCGETFDYADVESHCDHLLSRTSVRHIVNPVFRGGALIVPPVKPGWKGANASVLPTEVMQEAAAYAEQMESQYKVLADGGVDLTASAWESLMAMIVESTR